MARRNLGMTLEDVAQTVGVSRSFLSQVERGLTNPSITTLRRIATTLRVPLFMLFSHNDFARNALVKKHDRYIITLPQSNCSYELLTPDLNRKIEMVLSTLEAGARSCDEPMSHPGEECVFMLEGQALIEVGNQEFILEEGDSLYFDCGMPHRVTTLGEKTAIMISAITPPSF
jgi:transcriptional regulator with XRE-family HTH domain